MHHSHNEALAQSLSSILNPTGSLECQLSGYCAALRIRFYLWRMTRPNATCRLRTYKREVRAELFKSYCKQLHSLTAQEFYRIQEPEFFQNVERVLTSEPVSIAKITRPLGQGMQTFCSICQEEHEASDCVTPLGCSCSFGRDCLQPLLNRDTPCSYTCPNCRTRLHEPLKWRHVDTTGGWDLRLGLLWALRNNINNLQREVHADPDPFTPRQQIVGLLSRALFRQ